MPLFSEKKEIEVIGHITESPSIKLWQDLDKKCFEICDFTVAYQPEENSVPSAFHCICHADLIGDLFEIPFSRGTRVHIQGRIETILGFSNQAGYGNKVIDVLYVTKINVIDAPKRVLPHNTK